VSLFIGLDVGTQGVKLLAYDPKARHCAISASAPLDLLESARRTRATRRVVARGDPHLFRGDARPPPPAGAGDRRLLNQYLLR
jgi:sugar (pentulose or hexulose) kinase